MWDAHICATQAQVMEEATKRGLGLGGWGSVWRKSHLFDKLGPACPTGLIYWGTRREEFLSVKAQEGCSL